VTFDAADIARLEETYRDARNIRGETRPKDPKLEAVEAIIQAARAIPPVQGDKPAQRNKELGRLRDIAIVETLRSTGCRVGELVSLRRGDLDWMAQSALVKGKGQKYRKVYLDDPAWGALTTYLRARQDGGDARALSHHPVFCGHGNRSGRTPSLLTTRHVARTIQRLAALAGIAEVGVTPHYFRHVFATRALDRTENLALVQDMLGHASPATTRVYAKTDERQRREGYRRVWDADETEQDFEALAGQGPRFEAAVTILNAVKVMPGDTPVPSDLMRSAVVQVLWSTGCTLDELLALRLEDVDRDVGSLRFSSGIEHRMVPLDKPSWTVLRAFLEARERVETAELFCEEYGQPLSRERLLSICQDLARERGIDPGFVDQDLFRGVFIHRALDKTHDRRVVQRMVGSDLSAVDRIKRAS
jgi:site-specific recombinase XerD